MKRVTTYHANTPTTADGHSITITTVYFGTEEEIEYIKNCCKESFGSGLVQEFGSPLTSQSYLYSENMLGGEEK